MCLDVAGREPQAGRDQEGAEDVGGPGEPVEDDGAAGDESGAQHECAETPHSSARWRYCGGTAKYAKMTASTKTLSIERLRSIT